MFDVITYSYNTYTAENSSETISLEVIFGAVYGDITIFSSPSNHFHSY